MEKLNNLALRRNLFFPTSEIYPNSPAGFYDFGPIGVKIKNNVINFWRENLVEELNALEIDGSIILQKNVFTASGHIENFSDPVVQDLESGVFYRADKLLAEINIEVGEKTPLDQIDLLLNDNKDKLKKFKKGFGKAFHFNMMYKVGIGVGDGNTAYLKPEACQNIFLDFKRVYMGARRNLPLPIAQVTKAFRNEVAPRNGLIRLRELSQMDIEVFFNPKSSGYDTANVLNEQIPVKLLSSKSEMEFIKISELINKGILKYDFEAYLLFKIYEFYVRMGYSKELLRFKEVSKDDRAFYSLATWDLEALVEGDGWVEIVACNYRTDYDLKRHSEISKTKLSINENGEEFTPHIFELSAGVERSIYCLLAQSIETRKDIDVLKLKSEIAPYRVAIFPLMNKDGLDEIASDIYNKLKNNYTAIYDDSGSIGKRYARVDEIGVRYAITVDYQSKEDNTVTLRDSWTSSQIRVKIADISKLISN